MSEIKQKPLTMESITDKVRLDYPNCSESIKRRQRRTSIDTFKNIRESKRIWIKLWNSLEKTDLWKQCLAAKDTYLRSAAKIEPYLWPPRGPQSIHRSREP